MKEELHRLSQRLLHLFKTRLGESLSPAPTGQGVKTDDHHHNSPRSPHRDLVGERDIH